MTAEIEEVQKLDASEIYPRKLNAKEVLITPKNEEFVFPVADGSAKLSGRDYEFQEPTLRGEFTVERKNLNEESQGDREEFEPEETKDDEGINKDFGAHAKARKEFHCRHHIHSSMNKIYIIERNSSEKKCTMRREDWRSHNI